MATDGTKIIDGDTAHDTYWGIMDLYDSGAGLEMILSEFPLIHREFYDELDDEIYVTSCGLAYWEIGLMTPERLKYIEKVISKDAWVKEWTEYSEKEGKSRKNVLTRYLKKISAENTKIRKRKKYRKISNFIFNENDILSFKLNDNLFRAVICVKIEQYRGNCNYWLVPTTYCNSKKPNYELIKNEMILGGTIGSGYSEEMIKNNQPGIEKIWDYIGKNRNFAFGLVIKLIEHKDLLRIKDFFEKTGQFKIIEGLKEIKSFGYEDTIERFEEIFSQLEKYIEIFGYEKFPIKIMEETKL